MPTADDLKAMGADPAEYRKRLLIDCDGTAKPLDSVCDDWQRKDFEAMDNAWKRVAGHRVEGGCQRAYLERPRGHDKTSGVATMVSYPLLFSRRSVRGIGVAADQDQSRFLADGLARLKSLNPQLFATIEIQRDQITNTRTGSTLKIINSDAATSFGHLVDFVLADEISNWKSAELWESLFSAVAKKKHCVLVVAGNAGRGLDSWQYQIREAARLDPNWYFHSLPGPVASWISPELLAEQESILPPMVFRRLWLNQWSEGQGDALDPADVEACVTQIGPLPPRWQIERGGESGWTFTAGLDIGITHDHSALVVLGSKYGQERVRLAWCQSWKPPKGGKVRLEQVEAGILEAHRKYRISKLLYDPNQGAYLAERMQRAGLVCEQLPFVGRHLNEMASTVVETFRTRSIELYRGCPELIRDLKRLVIIEKSFGLKLEAPTTEQGHADNAFALAICLPEARRQSHFRSFHHEPPLALKIEREIARRFVQSDRRSLHDRRDPDREGWIRQEQFFS